MMRIISLALVVLCSAAAAQNPKAVVAPSSQLLSHGFLSFPNGIRVIYSTTGDNPRATFGNWGYADGPVWHHFLGIGNQYLGYDLEAEPLPGTDKVKLTFEPLSVDWEKEGTLALPGRQPALPAPQIIGPHEEIEMDLAVDPMTGHKITERLSFDLVSYVSSPETHDLTVDDVPMHLTLPTLFADGKLIGQSIQSSVAPIFAMHLPDTSDWIYVSFAPLPGYGFQKADVTRSSRALFAVGGHQFELRSRSQFGMEQTNLYVLLNQRPPASRGRIAMSFAPNAHPPKNYMELRAGTVKQMLP
jgi:hypothetical protein